MAKNKGIADLHVHTWYSDSSLSPEAVVEEARANGVTLLAVADHEKFEGSREAAALCGVVGIRLIPAAELTCVEGGIEYHVLCYGADDANAPLRAQAAQSRRILDDMSVWLVEKLAPEYPAVSVPDFQAFTYDRGLGGWKGLHYLLARGVTDSLRAGMALYARYGITYANAGFPDMASLLSLIHGAGGRAVLAHPGYTLRKEPTDAIVRQTAHLYDLGLDGLECHYPLHDERLTSRLIDLCQARGGMITAGSDCHGVFGRTQVGEMNVSTDQIDLRGL